MKHKKIILSILTMVMVLTQVVPSFAVASEDVKVTVDNEYVDFPDAKPYINKDNRTLVPVRFIVEKLGATVGWDGENRIVSIDKDDISIRLKIGESKATVNNKEVSFDTKAVIENDRTMVPLRFISETLKVKIEWVVNSRTVVITTKKDVPGEDGYTWIAGYKVPNPEHKEIKDGWVRVEVDPQDQYGDCCISVHYKRPENLKIAYDIIASKWGEDIAKQMIDYASNKKDQWDELEYKSFDLRYGQQADVFSAGGSMYIEFQL